MNSHQRRIHRRFGMRWARMFLAGLLNELARIKCAYHGIPWQPPKVQDR